MLLQVHDELLFECPAEDAEAVAALVRERWQAPSQLRVPLEVAVGPGPTWFDVH